MRTICTAGGIDAATHKFTDTHITVLDLSIAGIHELNVYNQGHCHVMDWGGHVHPTLFDLATPLLIITEILQFADDRLVCDCEFYTAIFASFVLKLFVTSAEDGGYVFGAVCLSVCLSVGLLANL